MMAAVRRSSRLETRSALSKVSAAMELIGLFFWQILLLLAAILARGICSLVVLRYTRECHAASAWHCSLLFCSRCWQFSTSHEKFPPTQYGNLERIVSSACPSEPRLGWVNVFNTSFA